MDYEKYSYSNNQYPNDYNSQSQETYANVENNQGSTYRMVNANRVDRSYIPQEPVKKPKKSGGFLKKALAGIALGVFFGISAGVSLYFVNLVTGVADLTKNETTVVEEVVPIEEAKEETVVSDSGIDMTSTQTVTTVVTDVTEVVENVMPAVVSITNIYTETTSFWGQR